MENQLQLIVKESGLETTKAQFILDNFQDYFAIASDWEKKAKSIVVSDETQVAEMKMAREGRLFLAKKRIDIEKARKALKEESLRQGKAIDGIANVLKGLIVPIEDYLEEQEKFAENKEKARLEAERLEAERAIEAKRIAEEEARKAEEARIRAENEKLKAEAEAQEKERARERAEAEAKLEAERKAKQAIIDEQKRKEEAEIKARQAEAEAQAKLEKGKKYQKFLLDNGYTEDT
jgi:hypothetical protein